MEERDGKFLILAGWFFFPGILEAWDWKKNHAQAGYFADAYVALRLFPTAIFTARFQESPSGPNPSGENR